MPKALGKNTKYSVVWDHTSIRTDLHHLKYQSKQWQWQAAFFCVERFEKKRQFASSFHNYFLSAGDCRSLSNWPPSVPLQPYFPSNPCCLLDHALPHQPHPPLSTHTPSALPIPPPPHPPFTNPPLCTHLRSLFFIIQGPAREHWKDRGDGPLVFFSTI